MRGEKLRALLDERPGLQKDHAGYLTEAGLADERLRSLAPTLAELVLEALEWLEWALGHVEDERPSFFDPGGPGAEARKVLARLDALERDLDSPRPTE